MKTRQAPLSVWLEPVGRMLMDYPTQGDPHAIADQAAQDIRRQKLPHAPEGLRIEVSQLYRRRHGRKILATVTV